MLLFEMSNAHACVLTLCYVLCIFSSSIVHDGIGSENERSYRLILAILFPKHFFLFLSYRTRIRDLSAAPDEAAKQADDAEQKRLCVEIQKVETKCRSVKCNCHSYFVITDGFFFLVRTFLPILSFAFSFLFSLTRSFFLSHKKFQTRSRIIIIIIIKE